MLLNFVHWNVDPEIFSIGPLSIRWYGLLFAAGFYLGYLIMSKMFKIEKVPQELLDKLLMYVFFGTIIGARLGHCLFYEPEFYLSNPIEIIKVWRGGLASHGGAIGILIAIYFFTKKYKKKYLWTMDRVVVVTALAGAFIRLGNLMNSEIYGHATTLPWGFIFEQNGETVPKHPTQIYESLSYLAIFLILGWIYKKAPQGKTKNGFIFGLFLILLFGARFMIEFVKEVQVDMEVGWTLNMGQWLSIPFILAGIYFVYRSLKEKK